MTRPLPDSDAYLQKIRRLRNRRRRRIALVAFVLMIVVAAVYVSTGGELRAPPQWLERLFGGGSGGFT